MKKQQKNFLSIALAATLAVGMVGLTACEDGATSDKCKVTIHETATDVGYVAGGGKYKKGTEVTALAVPKEGQLFGGWYNSSGECLSLDRAYTFTVEKDTSLTAYWGPVLADVYTWHDGRTLEEDYNESRQNKYFFSDKDDAVTYFANAMYEEYGDLDPSMANAYVGPRVGWTPAWFEWISLIRGWSDNQDYQTTWREYIIDQPICADGYVWSYDSTHWPNMGGEACTSGNGCHNYHYDNNFRYIISICNFIGWENSLDILSEVDDTDAPNQIDADQHDEYEYHKAEDVSKNMTLGAKLDLMVNYVLENLDGKNGLIIIGEEENDGQNVGTSDSYSCNYWDNIPFGYKSAYENILFYNSLKSLVELEKFRGNTEKVTYYQDLMETVKQKYNETFWSETTGRYIATVDINGVERDYGVTFVNTEAVSAGLASDEQAKSIYDWLDGKRIVSTDDKTGADIYGAKRSGGVSPITNTVDFGRTVAGAGNWWHDNGGSMALSGSGKFTQHVENGGTILYTEYYDIMGRLQMRDTASAYNRMAILAKEFAIDELNRDPLNSNGSANLLGFVGEFPESGLVPTAYLYGFIGLSQMAGGLRFDPQIPAGYEYMGVNDVLFQGQKYKITTYRDGKFELECASDLNMAVALKDVSSVGTRTITFYDASGAVISTQQVTAEDGEFTLNLKGVAGAVKAVLA